MLSEQPLPLADILKQYGIVPCAYTVPGTGTRIERRWSRPAPEGDTDDLWAIFNGASCLNRDNEWEYEPVGSSRSDEFKARTRYTLQEAMERVVAHFKLGLSSD